MKGIDGGYKLSELLSGRGVSADAVVNKTNILKEKPKVTYSVALLLAFLSAEKICHLPILAGLPERLLLSARTKSINKNFVN